MSYSHSSGGGAQQHGAGPESMWAWLTGGGSVPVTAE